MERGIADPPFDRLPAGRVRVVDEGGELVAADSGDDVGFAKGFAQGVRCGQYRDIPLGVSPAIVDRLQSVQVDVAQVESFPPRLRYLTCMPAMERKPRRLRSLVSSSSTDSCSTRR